MGFRYKVANFQTIQAVFRGQRAAFGHLGQCLHLGTKVRYEFARRCWVIEGNEPKDVF